MQDFCSFIKILNPKEKKITITQEHTDDTVKKESFVSTPFVGKLTPLSNVEDKVFSSEAMGKGFAIIPSNGTIYAPFDGKVASVFPTKHALCLVSESGIELLIHIGINTFGLEGVPFKITVSAGDYFKRGDILGKVDLKYIAKAGCQTTTSVIVTNFNDYSNIEMTEAVSVRNNDICLRLEQPI